MSKKAGKTWTMWNVAGFFLGKKPRENFPDVECDRGVFRLPDSTHKPLAKATSPPCGGLRKRGAAGAGNVTLHAGGAAWHRQAAAARTPRKRLSRLAHARRVRLVAWSWMSDPSFALLAVRTHDRIQQNRQKLNR